MGNKHLTWIAAAAGLALACNAWADGKLSNVSVSGTTGELKVAIDGSGLTQPTVISFSGGRDYYLDFDASFTGPRKHLWVNQNGVEYIEAYALAGSPEKARLRVHSTTNILPELVQDGGQWVVKLGKIDPAKFVGPATAPVIDAVKSSGPAVSTKAAIARRITLKFTNTEVPLVLRAIAMQADVNVIMSFDGAPTVSLNGAEANAPKTDTGGKAPNITIDLTDVSVGEALDFVASVTGLRWQEVGQTFVVTSAARYPEMMRTLANRANDKNEVRVVPIHSGQTQEIHDALLKWFGPSTLEVVVPDKNSAAQAAKPQADASNPLDPSKAGAQLASLNTSVGGDSYLFLIGAPNWVDEGEKLAERLDEDIVRSMVRPGSASNAPVAYGKATYECHNAKAEDLRTSVGSTYPSVQILASPKSGTQQTLVMSGPVEQIDQVLENVRQLDTGPGEVNFYVYNVAFADPRGLREQLVASVPGLQVNIPPASAGNPSLYKKGDLLQDSRQGAFSDPKDSSNPATGAVPVASGSSGGSVASNLQGLGDTYKGLEPTATPMKLLLRGSSEQIDEGIRLLKVIDTAPKQVALELRVMELSREDALNAGIDWSLMTGGAVSFVRLNNSQPTANNSLTGAITGRGFRGDVTATLDRLATHNNLIARPNLLALDGRESELFVGDVIRYIKTIQPSQNGTTVETGEERVGVRLSVLPRVSDGGTIIMDLEPVVSFLRGFTQVPGGGQLPQTSERSAQSTIAIQSGETIAIGGLIQDQDRKSVSGIPFLMDLPIFGHLFKSTSNDKVRTELVFFLTARAIDGPIHTGDTVLPMQNDMKVGKG